MLLVPDFCNQPKIFLSVFTIKRNSLKIYKQDYLNAKANIRRNIGPADLHCKTKENLNKFFPSFQIEVKRE